MGLYDSVFIDSGISYLFEEDIPLSGWQTKSLDCLLRDYYVFSDKDNQTRIALLSEPVKGGPFWQKYSKAEIKKLNESEYKIFKTKEGDGRFTVEAFHPNNRSKKLIDFTGNIKIYTKDTERGKEFLFHLFFEDGILTAIAKGSFS